MTWTITPRGYKTIVDMGAPNSAEFVGPNHAANAQLSAAAPCMLSALNGVHEFCQQGLNSPDPAHWEAALYDIVDLIQEAILKAEGA